MFNLNLIFKEVFMKRVLVFGLFFALNLAVPCCATSPAFWDSLDEEFSRMEKEMHSLHSQLIKEMQQSFKETDHVTVKKDKDALFAHIDLQNRNVSVEEVGDKVEVTFPVGSSVTADKIEIVLEEPKGGEPYVRVLVDGASGEKLKATIEERLVSVSLEQRVDHEKNDKKEGSNMVYVTSGMASVMQHRRLPAPVSVASVQSDFGDGKLTLSFDKYKPRKIEVKTGSKAVAKKVEHSRRDKHAK